MRHAGRSRCRATHESHWQPENGVRSTNMGRACHNMCCSKRIIVGSQLTVIRVSRSVVQGNR
jgi:hypothetical protein